MSDIGIIILAAGRSRRMGQSKQLLKIGKNTLIRHIIKIAESTDCAPIVAVLGNDFDRIKKEIATTQALPVFNEDWENGIGASISKGISEIQKLHPHLSAAIILLVDQPLVTANLLNQFIDIFKQTSPKIVVSKYAETYGVPALFSHSLFAKLSELKENQGAKKLIQKHLKEESIAFVDFPEGRFDLDTQSDYQHFLEEFGGK